jgi:hypothetical protein
MNQIVLFKIGSLHCRTVQEAGLQLRHRGREFLTGPIVAHLDERAEAPGNLGLIDLASGAVKIRWAVIATLPFLADATARGHVPEEESGPVRVWFEESGRVLEGDSGFDVKGPGHILPGSFLSEATAITSNRAEVLPGGPITAFRHGLGAGEIVRCRFVPEFSQVHVTLPDSLGGGRQHLNLTGGFSLSPLMSLTRPTVVPEWDRVEAAAGASA